jgi:hypothetical protein
LVLKPPLKPGLQYATGIPFKIRWCMKIRLMQVAHFFQKIDRQYIQVAVFLLALVLFVLGAGAPDDAGVGPR